MKREEQFPIRYLSVEEWGRLSSLKSLFETPRDDIIITLLYYTGCTVNELVNIKKKDINQKASTISISKKSSRNNSAREVYVSPNIIKKVLEYIDFEDSDSNYIFSTRQSPQMTTKRVRQIVCGLCKNIKINDATPQILRYTHIAHAYMKGIPVDAIQKQVGLRRSRAIEIFNQLRIATPKDAYKVFDS